MIDAASQSLAPYEYALEILLILVSSTSRLGRGRSLCRAGIEAAFFLRTSGQTTPAFGKTEMHWVDLLGYAASASVLATFCMSTIVPLRAVAIASNVLFAAYGALAHIYPVLLLHAVLLPVNTTRLLQVLVNGREPSAAGLASAPWMAALLSARVKLGPKLSEARGCVDEWRRRARERRELITLGQADRRDIRISHSDAQAEASKPFWRA